MNEGAKKDKLCIDYQGKHLNFDVAFGYLDRSYSEFNFATESEENIEGYSLNLNLDSLEGEIMRDLASIYNSTNKLYEITLNLDGLIHKGKAKIAKKFGIGGVNLDLELHTL